MKLKPFLIFALAVPLVVLSSASRADFFSSPFDMWDNNDDNYRYDRGGRPNQRDRWRNYDEWEPNYWRYRYFDDDSNDYFFDEFDGDYFGDGRGDFNFDMNMDFDGDSRYDGRYDNDYRYSGERRPYSSNPYSSNDGRSRNSGRPEPRYDERRGSANDDRYNDDYWRNYSQRYDGSRRQFDTNERDRRR